MCCQCDRRNCAVILFMATACWQLFDLSLHFAIHFVTVPHALANAVLITSSMLLIMHICTAQPGGVGSIGVVLFGVGAYVIYLLAMLYFILNFADIFISMNGSTLHVPPAPYLIIGTFVAVSGISNSCACITAHQYMSQIALHQL